MESEASEEMVVMLERTRTLTILDKNEKEIGEVKKIKYVESDVEHEIKVEKKKLFATLSNIKENCEIIDAEIIVKVSKEKKFKKI
jgi:hypothetical protein